MFKRMPSKLWLGIGAAAVVAIVVVIVVVLMKDEPETYRNINVYEYTGTAQVIRGEGKRLEVYENMRLESGDKLITGKDSYLQLKLDNDKYILLEAETEIKIVAEGTKKDSKTRISLEKGAIVNCLEEKLSDGSEYKIETPNSTMAVRGTTFRVQIETAEDGNVYASVSVFEGNVASKLIFPDGSEDDKEVSISTGKAVKIQGSSEDTIYVTVDDDVDYKELELEVLQFLEKSQENGKQLSIPEEELKEIISEIASLNNSEDKTTEDVTTGDASGDETTEEESTEDGSTIDESTDEESTTTDETSASGEEETTKKTTSTEKTTAKKDSTTGKETTKQQTTTKNQTTTKQQSTTKKQTTTKQQSTTGQQSTEETTTAATKTYVVIFMYNGKVFATQEVKAGNNVERPSLKPTKNGDWNYDFGNKVNSDITIEWTEG